MITIVVGTNRENSKSRKVAEYYAKLLASHGATSQILDLRDLPVDFAFTALYANTGKHEVFNEFVKIVNQSEKFVFIVPEFFSWRTQNFYRWVRFSFQFSK
jgi:chromate reductase, NAD(P)H dehydrogenase (quinone)